MANKRNALKQKRKSIGFGRNKIYVDEIKSVGIVGRGDYQIVMKDGRWYYFDPDVPGNEKMKRVLDKFVIRTLHI